jgi:hypothetical protein
MMAVLWAIVVGVLIHGMYHWYRYGMDIMEYMGMGDEEDV